MEKIITLNIKFNFQNTEDYIYPVVLRDDKETILVDCGYIGFLTMIENAFSDEGLEMKDLTKIIITHHDHDHMGSLRAIKEKYPHVNIISSREEKPFISGEMKAIRLEQAEKLQETLPDEHKAFGQAFCEMLRRVEPCSVDMTVNGGEMFDWCGGCEIIDTSGHTPGHISLYLKEYNTIITGDAAVLEEGRLVVANPQYAFDLKEAEESLIKLMEYKADTYICYHGGTYKNI